MNIDHITKSFQRGISEGYKVAQMPDGTFRVYLPEAKAKQRGKAFYSVDLMDPHTSCTCMAGRNHRRCFHLGMVEGFQQMQGGVHV